MAYCRWSTDDFQCDLYVWADWGGGWGVAVAARRTVFDEPLPEPVPATEETIDAWIERQRIVHDLPCHHEDIDLPHAGEIFVEPTAREAADRVARLRALGYRCPDHVEKDLREEDA